MLYIIYHLVYALRFLFSYSVWFLESGDLIFFLIVVSVTHYTTVLKIYDDVYTAVSIGALVDIGHYRSIVIASRYKLADDKSNQKEYRLRWLVAAVLTLLAGYYHWLFYQNILLTLPIPILIMFLAYMKQKDGYKKFAKPEYNPPTKPARAKSKPQKQPRPRKAQPQKQPRPRKAQPQKQLIVKQTNGLTKTEKIIIAQLQKDPKTTNVAIAKLLGISPQAIGKAKKKMFDNQIIAWETV